MRVDEFLIVGLLRRADARMTHCSGIARVMKFGRATIAPQLDNKQLRVQIVAGITDTMANFTTHAK